MKKKMKNPFKDKPYLFVIFALVGICGMVLWRMPFFNNIFTGQTDSKEDYSSQYDIEQLHSQKDADGDGINDQTDILQSARAYVKTKPKYKSKYYTTGYSDDGYGVCTDVVAMALLDAGYNLMLLVNQDILGNLADYNVEKVDINIDFRRVKNLNIFFKHTAKYLTTDPAEIEAWQGGDIVVFQNHIGVVSDKRNKNGVTYVIHHNDALQSSYEEDILESRDDIIGHYRIQ